MSCVRKKEKCTCAVVLLQHSLVTLGGKESEGASLSPFMEITKDWVAELTASSHIHSYNSIQLG
ncbi:hypothetical protein JHK85_041274 [Glycine max]|nr:hypothetical protein JHK87_040510 [Glycine soja]KAG4966299.1 hypothetical protein JHK85_041274 [Glycine max]